MAEYTPRDDDKKYPPSVRLVLGSLLPPLNELKKFLSVFFSENVQQGTETVSLSLKLYIYRNCIFIVKTLYFKFEAKTFY